MARMDDHFARTALMAAEAAVESARCTMRPAAMASTLAQWARCYRGMGHVDAAHLAFEQALPWTRLLGSTDATVDLLCELAECTADYAEALDDDEDRRAARRCARDHAREAWMLSPRVADAAWEIRVLLRVSEVLERLGDRADALALQTRANALKTGRAPAGPDWDAAARAS